MRQTIGKNKDHSTIAKYDYMLFLCFWTYIGALVVLLANKRLANCISTRQGYWVAVGVIGGVASITYFMTIKNRTRLQGLFGILIGGAGYTLFIYWRTLTSLCKTFISISLVLIFVSLILYLVVGRRKRRSVISYYFSRAIDSFYLSRMLIAMVAVVACLVLPITYRSQVNQIYTIGQETSRVENASGTFEDAYLKDGNDDGRIYSETEYAINAIYGDEYRLGLNIDRIKPVVSEEEWEACSLEQRQDTVIAIIECEARYLGVPFKLQVKFTSDLRYETKGYYSHGEHLICINNETLNDGGIDSLVTALHEIRHCYQHAMCDAYIKLTPEERNLFCFYGVDKWCENINNYVDGAEDYLGYWDQALEADCRSYAYKEAQEYVREIGILLSEEGEKE